MIKRLSEEELRELYIEERKYALPSKIVALFVLSPLILIISIFTLVLYIKDSPIFAICFFLISFSSLIFFLIFNIKSINKMKEEIEANK